LVRLLSCFAVRIIAQQRSSVCAATLSSEFLESIVMAKNDSKHFRRVVLGVILLRMGDLVTHPSCSQFCLKQFCDEPSRP